MAHDEGHSAALIPAPDRCLAQVHQVSKRFAPAAKKAEPVLALDGVSLDLYAGETVGLVGPDAAGKTTLMRMLVGLAEPDSGSISLFGRPVAALDRTLVGYMPQHGGLYAELTVQQNLDLYADLRGLPAADRAGRFAQLLDLTGLGAFTKRSAGKLSGGMRQKLALACAVVNAPPIMLLDEPSVGVDPVSRREIWQLIQMLAGDSSSVLWTTSILEDAELCDRVVLLHEGRCLFSGAPGEATGALVRRSWFMPIDAARRRPMLRAALDDPAVADGAIEGGGVRLLLREGAALPAGWQGQSVPVAPRFQDGFVVLLDRAEPAAPSAIAAAYDADKAHIGDAPTMIEAQALTRRYGSFTAASEINLAVKRGEIFGLLGPNGAGKSTSFRMLCGLLRPTSGSGRVAGHDLIRASAEARQALGYMPQKFSLYVDLTVAANLKFVAGAYGLGGAKARMAMDRVVDALDLAAHWSKPAGVLPLGIKQRLALAAAVMHRPQVLFLDEPTSGIDPLERRRFWHHINALADQGVTIFTTTHFMDEAEYCDRVALIYQSRMIAEGTPDDLKRLALGDRGRQLPTLEDAFIRLILASDAPTTLATAPVTEPEPA